MKRSLKAALMLAPWLFALTSVECLADPAAKQIAFNTYSNTLDVVRAQGRGFFAANQYSQAAGQYLSICRTQSATASDYYWLGESQYHLGAYDAAARAFENALQLSPDMETLYSRLADTYLALSSFDRVQQICSKGLSVVKDPNIRSRLQSLIQCSKLSLLPRKIDKASRCLRVE